MTSTLVRKLECQDCDGTGDVEVMGKIVACLSCNGQGDVVERVARQEDVPHTPSLEVA